MDIMTQQNGDSLTISIKGFIDSSTAPNFEKSVLEACKTTKKLTLNFAEVDFVSSAGLRVLLIAKKTLSAVNGDLAIINANDEVRELFDLTGFSDIL